MQQHESSNYAEDPSYEHDHTEQRPQSRASQHDAHPFENNGVHHGRPGGNSNHRTQHQRPNDPLPSSAYQHQSSQFDDPGRSDDDDMW